MAIGDDAAAAGMLLVDGAVVDLRTIDTEVNRTRDYIAQGMGATDALVTGKVIKRDSDGRAKIATPAANQDIANKQYVDGVGTVNTTGDTIMRRTGDGRSKVSEPTFDDDIANKLYVETYVQGRLDDYGIGSLGDVAFENVVPVGMGGTGNTTASGARSALGAAAADHTHSALSSGAGISFGYNGGFSSWYTDDAMRIDGNFRVPNATGATDGYVVAYINSDGRLCKGTSSERYKDQITPIEALALGSIFPDLYEYVMRGDPDQTIRVGHIAERLAESPDLERFVVYKTEQIIDEPGSVGGYRLALDEHGNPIPDSIDFIALLLAQTAQLHARLAALEARE